jgi:hypothetical protein
MKTIKLSTIKPNPDNPRVMRDDQFRKLVANIKRYPHFLDKRGIVHADGVILGGNMRYRAIAEALKDESFRAKVGVTKCNEIPATWIQDASAWSEEDRQAFIILDNSPQGVSGEWDWDLLANKSDPESLNEWGLYVPIAKTLTPEQIKQLENTGDATNSSEESFESEMSKKTPGVIPIIPKYDEHYQAFIIVCDNRVDEAWIRKKLNLESPHQSYKDSKIRQSNVITLKQLKTLICAKS